MTSTKSDDRQASSARWYCALWLSLALLVLPGCNSTIGPGRVHTSEASFDGNEQNSGIVSSSPAGFVVTDHFIARYNVLVTTYGRDFSPALKPNEGVLLLGEGRWLVTKQVMVNFLTMNQWRKARLEPKNL